MNQFIKKIQKIEGFHLTDSRDMVNIYETREMGVGLSRDIEIVKNQKIPTVRDSLKWTRGGLHPLLQEALFVAPDNVRNVRTISVCSNYTPIHKSVKWVCG